VVSPGEFRDCGPCETKGHCASVCGNKISGILGVGADRIGAVPGLGDFSRGLASLIDHTLLKPDANRSDFEKLCDEAARYGFASVCVNPYWVPFASDRLRSSPVRVCSVVGFPFGATPPEVKAFETRTVRDLGAVEFDMVINIGALKSGNDALVRRDIEGVVRAAGPNGTVKVILETSYLTDEEKDRGCCLAQEAGAHFVKTSTGYGPGGATVEDIQRMRRAVGPRMGVKASGGIRDETIALRMIQAGASRIGASASVRIVTGNGGGKAGGY